MHIGQVIHRDQINQIKTKVFTNQINQISYSETKQIILSLPFTVNEQFHNLIAWQLRRIGVKRFTECADIAKTKNSPERYFMTCLKQEKACRKGK